MFRFKRFTIHDDRCAMKVGTDGVLLGCWAALPIQGQGLALDVGAGSGLIALILAQRYPTLQITALEIDPSAADQAAENVVASPFAAQVEVVCGDFLHHPLTPQSVAAIMSNPPYFEEDLLAPNPQRAQARHATAGLTFEALIARSAELLQQGGSLQVVLPTTAQSRFHTICNQHGLNLVRETKVQTTPQKAPKRVLLHFEKAVNTPPVQRDTLSL
ncbi:MAG: methyltransferase, partial [Bacteroidaceae bacterium]|nr:methyltransferase [Bacteroidaceae bacterium]